MTYQLRPDDRRAAKACKKSYIDHEGDLGRFKESLLSLLTDHEDLRDWVHSSKARLKGAEKVEKKVLRKIAEANDRGQTRTFTYDNALTELTDLVGVRLLHLYTRQFEEINKRIMRVLEQANYNVREGPIAKTWDDEYRDYFKSIGVVTEPNKQLYTSVHYLIESNSKLKMVAELQVRTLAERALG